MENNRNIIANSLLEWTRNSTTAFINAENDKELLNRAKKLDIVLPSPDLAVFKTVYAEIDKVNRNGVILPRKAVEKGLPTLRGKQINWEHEGAGRICGYILDAKIEGDKIVVYGVLFKSLFIDEFEEVEELFAQKKLFVSFEIWNRNEKGDSVVHETSDGNIALDPIIFHGCGLLLENSPACPNARVLQLLASKKVIEEAEQIIKKVFEKDNRLVYAELAIGEPQSKEEENIEKKEGKLEKMADDKKKEVKLEKAEDKKPTEEPKKEEKKEIVKEEAKEEVKEEPKTYKVKEEAETKIEEKKEVKSEKVKEEKSEEATDTPETKIKEVTEEKKSEETPEKAETKPEKVEEKTEATPEENKSEAEEETKAEEPKVETKVEEKEEAKFECEYLKCGKVISSSEHCRDTKCPECGGEMRRKDRPGTGKGEVEEKKEEVIKEEIKDEKKEDAAKVITKTEVTEERENKDNKVSDEIVEQKTKVIYTFEQMEEVKQAHVKEIETKNKELDKLKAELDKLRQEIDKAKLEEAKVEKEDEDTLEVGEITEKAKEDETITRAKKINEIIANKRKR